MSLSAGCPEVTGSLLGDRCPRGGEANACHGGGDADAAGEAEVTQPGVQTPAVAALDREDPQRLPEEVDCEQDQVAGHVTSIGGGTAEPEPFRPTAGLLMRGRAAVPGLADAERAAGE